MKFYLLQKGHSHSENTLHVFDTAEERDAMTKELIYGTGELCPDDQRGLALYLEELREDGSVEFEGDPGLEWFTATPALREPKKADLHVRMALRCLEELEPEAMRWKQRVVRNFNEHSERENQLSAARVSLDHALDALN
jgi:hypothetical protein